LSSADTIIASESQGKKHKTEEADKADKAAVAEVAAQDTSPVAFFRAPTNILIFVCAGDDKIALGCVNRDVLLLQAAYMVA